MFDGRGSVIALVDTNGAQRAAYTYDPYGDHATATPINGTTLPPNPWRFSGAYLDSTGLYKMGARYYDPRLGRFTQLDPSGQSTAYTYAGGDPVNLADPDGREDRRALPPELDAPCFYRGPVYGPAIDALFESNVCVHYRTAYYNSDPSIFFNFVERGIPYWEASPPGGCSSEVEPSVSSLASEDSAGRSLATSAGATQAKRSSWVKANELFTSIRAQQLWGTRSRT